MRITRRSATGRGRPEHWSASVCASLILVVNAGSTSLKLHLVGDGERSEPLASFEALAHLEPGRIAAVAHRIVHGGARFREATLVDSEVRDEIVALEGLAPLHNAAAIEGIQAAEKALPGTPQVAVFDTTFHNTMPEAASVYAVPRSWREEFGIRRYGFHGLSVAWCAEQVPRLLQRRPDELRLVVCHLGGGCSVTAVKAGRSVDTTMGFSPLEGLPMTTRSGSIDPGALTYLMREHGLDAEELERTLNLDSGLKALAGGSGSMLEIEQAAAVGDAGAELALEVFLHGLTGAIATMTAALGGLDALAFTAGIGEGSALVRRLACRRLGFFGVDLDEPHNERAEPDCDVAAPESPVRVVVVHAREELIAARSARALLAGA